jgi:predicted small secreted protein
MSESKDTLFLLLITVFKEKRMRLFISVLAAVMLGVMALAACNSNDGSGKSIANANNAGAVATAPKAPNTPADGARRITTVELHNALDKGEAVVVDVRNDTTYKLGHIKGALLIPAGEVGAHVSELPKDKLIVTYCS